MKVLLVKPYNLSDHIQPSLGLGWLATAVRDRHDVSILDCIKQEVKPDGKLKKIDNVYTAFYRLCKKTGISKPPKSLKKTSSSLTNIFRNLNPVL